MRMSNETMNLFLAPWEIEQNMDVFEIYNCKDTGSFACTDEKNAHRFVRLPEMYDALNKQTYYRCVDCLRHTANTIDDIPLNRDMIEHGCPKNRTDCGAFDAWKLLKKVRDGE